MSIGLEGQNSKERNEVVADIQDMLNTCSKQIDQKDLLMEPLELEPRIKGLWAGCSGHNFFDD